jgi:hypothetical protein
MVCGISLLGGDESSADRQRAIGADCLPRHPFVWTATVESIQEKLSRCRQTLEQIAPGSNSPKTRKRKGTV